MARDNHSVFHLCTDNHLAFLKTWEIGSETCSYFSVKNENDVKVFFTAIRILYIASNNKIKYKVFFLRLIYS